MAGSAARRDDIIRFAAPASVTMVPHEVGMVRVPVQSNPTGRYGVAVARVSFGSGTTISGTANDHMIGIGCSPSVPTEHRIEGRQQVYETGPGSLCICPAGARYFTAFAGSMSGIILRVSPECLTLAKEELGASSYVLTEKMDGEDTLLTKLAQTLEAEAAADHPNGMLFWNSVTDMLFGHLARHHLSDRPTHNTPPLNKSALWRVERFISENLSEPLLLDSLAAVAGCGRFQFARRFHAAVGVTPHRYVVRRRLKAARAMMSTGKSSLAEISAATGFVDQSHMTKWMRRVYGTTPSQLVG